MGDDQDTRQAAGAEVLAGGRAEGRSAKKTLILLVKIIIMLAVLGFVGRVVYKSWTQVQGANIAIDWRWGALAAAGFCGSMLTSGMVWMWLARKMGDRSPAVPMLGAYTFSQMGKYVPGKIALLLMRIERAGRFGMSGQVCTLATLQENALYMVSGGLVGMSAIVRVAGELDPRVRPFVWPLTAGAVVVLAAACYPPIFYALVNRVLRGMKKPEVAASERLSLGVVTGAVVGFVPCWLFGGLALWASAQAVHEIPIADCWWFPGAFALSVIIGMGSLLPGGAGIREAVLGAAVLLEFQPFMPPANAVIAAGAAAILQRVFQLAAELVLGVAGGAITSAPSPESGGPR